ncbi:MAG: DUF4236 domain-containing protein [Ruminococcus sp.]|nr:DUF4236 domain-containing protein [Ruminococcus sp.]
MGFNFRKSFSLGNGVRVTVGKKSASVSVGRKGVRGSISTTGKATGTVSIPGTGLSYSASKKISDLIPGKKDEDKKTTAKKTSKTSSSKTASAKTSAAKTSSAKTSSSKTVSSKTAAKSTSTKTSAKTAAAKTTAAKKPAPAKAAPEPAAETPSNPFSTGKAKKLTED